MALLNLARFEVLADYRPGTGGGHGAGPSDGGCCHTADRRNAPTYPSLAFTRVDLTSSGGLHGLGLLVGFGATAALFLIVFGALTVAASEDTEATEAVVSSFELGEAPAKRKG